jgi:predicted ArsR family transcriptional regulator
MTNTSRRAYNALVASGLLVGKQEQIMAMLASRGPATSGELLARLAPGENTNAWRARFTELQGRGLIREVEQRRCKISGRTCVVWGLTGRDKPLERKRGATAPSAKTLLALLKRAYEYMREDVMSGEEMDGDPPDLDDARAWLDDYRKATRGRR